MISPLNDEIPTQINNDPAAQSRTVFTPKFGNNSENDECEKRGLTEYIEELRETIKKIKPGNDQFTQVPNLLAEIEEAQLNLLETQAGIDRAIWATLNGVDLYENTSSNWSHQERPTKYEIVRYSPAIEPLTRYRKILLDIDTGAKFRQVLAMSNNHDWVRRNQHNMNGNGSRLNISPNGNGHEPSLNGRHPGIQPNGDDRNNQEIGSDINRSPNGNSGVPLSLDNKNQSSGRITADNTETTENGNGWYVVFKQNPQGEGWVNMRTGKIMTLGNGDGKNQIHPDTPSAGAISPTGIANNGGDSVIIKPRRTKLEEITDLMEKRDEAIYKLDKMLELSTSADGEELLRYWSIVRDYNTLIQHLFEWEFENTDSLGRAFLDEFQRNKSILKTLVEKESFIFTRITIINKIVNYLNTKQISKNQSQTLGEKFKNFLFSTEKFEENQFVDGLNKFFEELTKKYGYSFDQLRQIALAFINQNPELQKYKVLIEQHLYVPHRQSENTPTISVKSPSWHDDQVEIFTENRKRLEDTQKRAKKTEDKKGKTDTIIKNEDTVIEDTVIIDQPSRTFKFEKRAQPVGISHNGENDSQNPQPQIGKITDKISKIFSKLFKQEPESDPTERKVDYFFQRMYTKRAWDVHMDLINGFVSSKISPLLDEYRRKKPKNYTQNLFESDELKCSQFLGELRQIAPNHSLDDLKVVTLSVAQNQEDLQYLCKYLKGEKEITALSKLAGKVASRFQKKPLQKKIDGLDIDTLMILDGELEKSNLKKRLQGLDLDNQIKLIQELIQRLNTIINTAGSHAPEYTQKAANDYREIIKNRLQPTLDGLKKIQDNVSHTPLYPQAEEDKKTDEGNTVSANGDNNSHNGDDALEKKWSDHKAQELVKANWGHHDNDDETLWVPPKSN